ncbi:MAG TPA: TIGR02186 family protein, partial [Phenylobacterium sp.]
QPIRIARKRRVAGLWVNGRPVRFEGAPGFYRAASTRPLAQIAPAATLRRMGAGVDNLVIDAPAEPRVEARYGARDVVVSRGPDYENWRAAAAQLRRNRGLYAEDAAGVRFVDKHLFRADIDLPAAAPTGKYRAEIFLFQDGRPVASQARELTVEKGGPERALYLFAKQRPWLYGLASVALALAAGWAASVAFRRT